MIVHYPAHNGGFVWDDDYYVTKNSLLTSPDGLQRIWFSLDAPSQYFPLTYTALRFERAIWGLDPAGYHWVNILLHAINSLLVWRLLARLRIPWPWLAAMIFALHPVQVESVAWISEQKNVLMGAFFLLTLLGWVWFLDAAPERRRLVYMSILASYTLALSAKSTACTLPAAMVLILWLQKKPINRERMLQIAPFVLLAVAMGVVTMWWERFHVGTRGAGFALGPVERLLVACRNVWFYIDKLFWPSRLTFSYPQWKIAASDPTAYLWMAALLAAGCAIYYWRRSAGRGPEVAAIFFVATLGPLLGFIMLYTFRFTFVADHYQYLASIGPIALVSAGLARLHQAKNWAQRVVPIASALILSALSILTWRQSATYRDAETLWRSTLEKNPDSWMAYNNLGIDLFEKGRYDEAIDAYNKSLVIHPGYVQTHYNLANTFAQKGEMEQALTHCREAVALAPNDPNAHSTMGNALMGVGSIDDAMAEYAKALELQPNHVDALYHRGIASLQKRDVDAAEADFTALTKADPEMAEAQLQLGNICLQKQNLREAIQHFETALRLHPDWAPAQNNLAWVLASAPDTAVRDGKRAVEIAERANSLAQKETPLVLHTLAAAYAQDRQFERAVATAERALQLADRDGASGLASDLRREINFYAHGSSYPTN